MIRLLATAIATLSIAPAAVAAPVWQKPAELASGDVTDPVIAASDVGAAVAWAQQLGDGCGQDLGCFRVRVSTRTSDGEFLPAVTLSADGTSAGYEQVATTPAGEVLVAWCRAASSADDPDLEVVEGGLAGGFGPVTVVPTETPSCHLLGLEANARGDAILSWVDWVNGRAHIRVSLRQPGGDFGPPESVAEPTGWPHAVTLSDDGRLMVVWADRDPDGTTHVYARERSAVGVLTEPQLVQSIPPARDTSLVGGIHAAWTPRGDKVAAWWATPKSCTDCEDPAVTVYAAWSQDDGELGTPQPLSASNDVNGDVQLAVDRSGRAVVAWRRGGEYSASPRDIRVAQRGSGGTFSRPVSVGHGDAASPRLIAGRRDVLLMWKHVPYGLPATLDAAFRPEDRAHRITRTVARGVAPWGMAAVAVMPTFREFVAVWRQGGQVPPYRLLAAQAPDDSVPPRIDRFRARPRVINTPRTAVELRFRLSERANLELQLRRIGTRRPQRERYTSRRAGARRWRLPARYLRTLPDGRYRATIYATDPAGQTTRSRRASIVVRRR